jgi:hypothetical protein
MFVRADPEKEALIAELRATKAALEDLHSRLT